MNLSNEMKGNIYKFSVMILWLLMASFFLFKIEEVKDVATDGSWQKFLLFASLNIGLAGFIGVLNILHKMSSTYVDDWLEILKAIGWFWAGFGVIMIGLFIAGLLSQDNFGPKGGMIGTIVGFCVSSLGIWMYFSKFMVIEDTFKSLRYKSNLIE